jgi:hypothetical protein
VSRWVPDVNSLGVYLTNNKGVEAEHRGYQVQTSWEGFCKAHEVADGNYWQRAQGDLLRHGAAYFKQEFRSPAALRDALQQAVRQKAGRIDAWLELLPHLCDEHGNPWNAAQLVHDVQAA